MNSMPKSSVRGVANKSRKPVMGERVKVAIVQTTAQGVHNANRTTSFMGLDVSTASDKHLLSLSTVRSVRPKQLIFREGDSSNDLFAVLHGIVMMSKLMPDGRRQVTGFLYPGRMLGLGVDGTYTNTAEAVTHVQLRRYPRTRLENAVTVYPAVGRRLLDGISAELAAAQDQMLLLGRKTAIERVASFFLTLSEYNEKHGESPIRLNLPMTRNDIGDFLGLTTETVSRTIGELKRMAIIEVPNFARVILLDIDGLVNLADDACGLPIAARTEDRFGLQQR